MSRWSQKTISCLALSIFMAASVQAGQDSAESKADARKTKVVKQADGSEVIRLATLPYSPSPFSQEQSQGSWGEAGAAPPRLMTALATLPGMLRGEGQNLPDAVDPSQVRSWAEFIDPSLALQWKSFAQINGFYEALLRLTGKDAQGMHVGGLGVPMPGKAPGDNGFVGNTWRNVVSEGAKHDLSGQQALREWLVLPMPEPKSNPWLSSLGGYRY